MQFSKSFMIASLAGTALSAVALAQQSDTTIPNSQARVVQPGMIRGGSYAVQAAPGGYSNRVDLDVYDTGIPTESGGDWRSSGVNTYDDVTVGGPYTSNANPLVINGVAIGFIVPANATAADDHLYTRLSFYPNHDNVIAAPATPFSGTPIVWNLDWGAGWSAAAGFISYYPASVTFNGSTTLSNADVFNGGATDRTMGLLQELFLDAALTRYADNWQIVRRGNIPASATAINCVVGSTDLWGWFSAATGVTGPGITQANRSGGTQTNNRATYIALQGTGFGVTEPASEPLGTLADGNTTRAGVAIPNAGVKWYSFEITNGAVDGTSTFLDMDSEGSAADVSIAVYDGNTAAVTYGNVAQQDADSGSGTNAMLSFGLGRRAAVGDGRQYDGRNFYAGAAGLPAGRYLVAVAPAGSAFANGFNVTAGATGGTAAFKISTNVNGTPIGGSVAPNILAVDDMSPSPLVAPGAQAPAVGKQSYDPRWVRFTTCVASDNTNTVTLDFTGTDTTGATIVVFDSSGNNVAQQNFTPVTPSGTPLPMVFDSTTVLPAGTYYVGMAFGGAQTSPLGRWHLRDVNGDNGFNYAVSALVTNTDCGAPCPGNACGNQDFNGDGDFGTDQDIEAFFACLGGNCCATCFCQGSDFNGDGDFGTDQDIEAFFRVLGGGNC